MRVTVLVAGLIVLLAACGKSDKTPVATPVEISESIQTEADPAGRITDVWGPKRSIHADDIDNGYSQLHSYRSGNQFLHEARFFFSSKRPMTWTQALWPGGRSIPIELIDRKLPPNPGVQATQETYRCLLDRELFGEMAEADGENKVTLQAFDGELVVSFPATLVQGYLDYLKRIGLDG